jgi:hypothetical protein
VVLAMVVLLSSFQQQKFAPVQFMYHEVIEKNKLNSIIIFSRNLRYYITLLPFFIEVIDERKSRETYEKVMLIMK